MLSQELSSTLLLLKKQLCIIRISKKKSQQDSPLVCLTLIMCTYRKLWYNSIETQFYALWLLNNWCTFYSQIICPFLKRLTPMMFNLMEENFCAFRWKIICLVGECGEATDCQQHHVNMSCQPLNEVVWLGSSSSSRIKWD